MAFDYISLGAAVVQTGGNFAIGAIDAKKRRELEERLATMNAEQRDRLIRDLASATNALEQKEIMLRATMEDRSKQIFAGIENKKAIALMVIAGSVLSLVILAVIKRRK